MLKFRTNARNRILCDFLSQPQIYSPNRVMICAGPITSSRFDPTKTLTTLRQIAGHNNIETQSRIVLGQGGYESVLGISISAR